MEVKIQNKVSKTNPKLVSNQSNVTEFIIIKGS